MGRLLTAASKHRVARRLRTAFQRLYRDAERIKLRYGHRAIHHEQGKTVVGGVDHTSAQLYILVSVVESKLIAPVGSEPCQAAAYQNGDIFVRRHEEECAGFRGVIGSR